MSDASPSAPTIVMRTPCRCGGKSGHIVTRGGQDGVYCDRCSRYQYNAPRLETGRAQRTLSKRPGITPAQRARIYTAHDHACIGCGQRPPAVELTLEHVLSRELAAAYDMLDAIIDSEWNLAPMCPECNSGHRWISEPQVRLMYRVLMIKATPRPNPEPPQGTLLDGIA